MNDFTRGYMRGYKDAQKEALSSPNGEAQPEQEPFTHYRHYDGGLQEWPDEKTIPLYTTPPQQSAIARKPLTDEEIMEIGRELGLKCRLGGNSNIDFDYARAIEAAHGITKEDV